MVSITEVTVFSVDKSDCETWSIEGEILFEEDLTTPFSAVYVHEDDEFEDFEMEINPGRYDKNRLKQLILRAAKECDDI